MFFNHTDNILFRKKHFILWWDPFFLNRVIPNILEKCEIKIRRFAKMMGIMNNVLFIGM